MINQAVVFSLEPIESRYTSQWFVHIPRVLAGKVRNVLQIDGVIPIKKRNLNGAFLDFVGTNEWKSQQLLKFLSFYEAGQIEDDALIIFTDFWNPSIIQVKYIKDLLGKKWKIVSMAHAGSYDPHDFLGRLIEDKSWSSNFERAAFYACDQVLFATWFHIRLFAKAMGIDPSAEPRFLRSGFPMEYIQDSCRGGLPAAERENLVVFPHRIAPEKNIDDFRKLSVELKKIGIQTVVCQDYNLSKFEYYSILKKAKIVWSKSEQETLGIGVYEGMEAGCIPMVPDRLSYTEMYEEKFRYSDEDLMNPDVIKRVIDGYGQNSQKEELDYLREYYFSWDSFLKTL